MSRVYEIVSTNPVQMSYHPNLSVAVLLIMIYRKEKIKIQTNCNKKTVQLLESRASGEGWLYGPKASSRSLALQHWHHLHIRMLIGKLKSDYPFTSLNSTDINVFTTQRLSLWSSGSQYFISLCLRFLRCHPILRSKAPFFMFATHIHSNLFQGSLTVRCRHTSWLWRYIGPVFYSLLTAHIF